MREIRLLRSMSGVWKRSYNRPTKAPPDERGGNRHGRPNTTAPHPDSTKTGCCGWTGASGRCGVESGRSAVAEFLQTGGTNACGGAGYISLPDVLREFSERGIRSEKDLSNAVTFDNVLDLIR